MRETILGLPKNIFFLGLTSLFNDFSSEMVFSVFPAFFIAVLHVGAASLGLVDGTAEAASNLFKIYSGTLSDRLGSRKPLVLAGYAVAVATRPFYALVSSVPGALSLRFLDRVGKGLRDAPRDAIISLSTPRETLGRSFGYHRAMDTAGGILGPLVAYLVLRSFPLQFNIVFAAAFVVGLFALLSLIFVSDAPGARAVRRAELVSAFKRLSPQFKIFLLSMFILSAGSLPVAVVLLKANSLGLTIADIPLYYMLYSTSYAGFSMSAGKLSDRIGTRTVIFIGYTVLIGSYVLLSLAEGAWMLALSFLIFGLFPALTDGVQRALASQLTTEDVRGGGMGWLNASVGFGALAAGIGGGYLWQVYGPTLALVAGAIVVLAGLALFAASARWEATRPH